MSDKQEQGHCGVPGCPFPLCDNCGFCQRVHNKKGVGISQATGKIFCEEFTACVRMQPQSGDSGAHSWLEKTAFAWHHGWSTPPIDPEKPEQNAPHADCYEVYEVYGKTSQANGWDFVVCRSRKDSLAIVESDMDELDADAEDEVRVRFRRYTKEQMDEVIYE